MKDELKEKIQKYKEKHSRFVKVNFEGEEKEYPVDQPGVDIIEELELIIARGN